MCREQAQAIGPQTGSLVQGLLSGDTTTGLREAQAVLRLTERYTTSQVEQACARALASSDGRLRTVRGLLERALATLDPPPPSAPAGLAGALLRGPAAFAEYAAAVSA